LITAWYAVILQTTKSGLATVVRRKSIVSVAWLCYVSFLDASKCNVVEGNDMCGGGDVRFVISDLVGDLGTWDLSDNRPFC
jgi:hypothetical protein